MDLIKNNKLKRAADYSEKGANLVQLYTLNDNGTVTWLRAVTREVAHEWLHGHEARGTVPETDPTVDDMIEVISNQLKAEVALYMEWALDSEDALRAMYRACGSKTPMHVGTGKFRLTRAKW